MCYLGSKRRLVSHSGDAKGEVLCHCYKKYKICLDIAMNWGAPSATTGWSRRKHISESLHPKMALQWAAVLLISGSRTGLHATAIQTHNCVLLPFLGGGPSYLGRKLTITQHKLLAGWYLWHCRGKGRKNKGKEMRRSSLHQIHFFSACFARENRDEMSQVVSSTQSRRWLRKPLWCQSSCFILVP